MSVHQHTTTTSTTRASACTRVPSITDADSDSGIEIDERDRRAATESMTVVYEGRATWTVYSGETSEYGVFLVGDDWKCECDDHHWRNRDCKHIRRIQQELGLRPIPETSGRSDVELMMEASG